MSSTEQDTQAASPQNVSPGKSREPNHGGARRTVEIHLVQSLDLVQTSLLVVGGRSDRTKSQRTAMISRRPAVIPLGVVQDAERAGQQAERDQVNVDARGVDTLIEQVRFPSGTLTACLLAERSHDRRERARRRRRRVQ